MRRPPPLAPPGPLSFVSVLRQKGAPGSLLRSAPPCLWAGRPDEESVKTTGAALCSRCMIFHNNPGQIESAEAGVISLYQPQSSEPSLWRAAIWGAKKWPDISTGAAPLCCGEGACYVSAWPSGSCSLSPEWWLHCRRKGRLWVCAVLCGECESWQQPMWIHVCLSPGSLAAQTVALPQKTDVSFSSTRH